jgi:hypothetical protein
MLDTFVRCALLASGASLLWANLCKESHLAHPATNISYDEKEAVINVVLCLLLRTLRTWRVRRPTFIPPRAFY